MTCKTQRSNFILRVHANAGLEVVVSSNPCEKFCNGDRLPNVVRCWVRCTAAAARPSNTCDRTTDSLDEPDWLWMDEVYKS